MLKITIKSKNRSQVQIFSEEMIDPSVYGHGRPERWQKSYSRWDREPGVEPYDPADVIAEEDRPSAVDPSKLERWVKLRAEYNVTVEDVSFQFAMNECMEKRKEEYPTFGDFLNAYFDGKPSLEELKALRLSIKEKYPKPSST
jgi:hypothetical protein